MKKYLRRYLSLLLLFFAVFSVNAQTADGTGQVRGKATAARRSAAQIKSAVAQKIGADRALRLRPVIEREVISVLSDSLAGFAVVGYNMDFPAVLAYGDGHIDAANPSPEFLYLLDLYEQALSTPEEQVQAVRAKAPARASAINVNISPMLKTTWAQRSPYNLRTPVSGSKHMLTGCVATAFAQVFKYYERPKKMHGYRRYHFNNPSGQREFCDYDYSTASFDWGNMPKKLKDDGFLGIGNTSNTQNQAVAELMYATGVLSSMMYGLDGSGAITAAATACIDAACEDLTAYYTQYEDNLVMTELREGRPVVFAGSNDKSEGHCFVIDGCRSDGYLHCNLGWDGTDDGYYLPTDMKGYCFYQNIAIVQPVDQAELLAPMPEMAGRTVRASRTAATELQPNRWYVMWNSGRCASPASTGVNTRLGHVGTIPAGETTEICGGQLVRFLLNDDGTYYIQTALGDYWNTIVQSGSYKTSDVARQKFNIGTFSPGYFYMKCGTVTVDSDGLGGNVVGWGNGIPSDIYSNASWQIFPVELGESPNFPTPIPLDEGTIYTLRNTGSNGYSMGYLVALDENDERPTLRGVVKIHDNGCNSDSYKTAPDFDNPGSFWQILSDGYKLYLYNCGTKKFLTNDGNGTPYVFTDEARAINITLGSDGNYRFNVGTDAQSYLCAATHLNTPAAFWTADDEGSKWTVAEVEDAPVQPTTYYAFKGGSTGTGATIKNVVDAVSLRRLDLIDLVVRGALQRQR